MIATQLINRNLFRLLATIGLLALIILPEIVSEAYGINSITDRSINWPSLDQWRRLFFLEDYNTRVVVFGTSILGAVAGLLGSFTLLRKRALMGDALSHATLPGICLAFLVSTKLGLDGKSLPLLLLGATISGTLGVGLILLIRKMTRLKEDAALGVVLSTFFGAGVALLGIVQQVQTGSSAGLESFIYGKTASMISSDATTIAISALCALFVCIFLFKEFKLLCFDDAFALSQGWPVLLLDIILMALVVGITVVGLQAVGLILIIALLIIPAAAARFWTERMSWMVILSALIGTLSGLFGASMSALFPRLPSGAMIVMVAAAFFAVSMLFGSARGVIKRALQRASLNRKIAKQHLLRAIFEACEGKPDSQSSKVPLAKLMDVRSWSRTQLLNAISSAENLGLLIYSAANKNVQLTSAGFELAARFVREHRLWEMYLITHADIAPSHVDRDADAIEHVLSPEMIRELEALLLDQAKAPLPPDSPHQIGEAQ